MYPFFEKEFSETWKSYFAPDKDLESFEFIGPLSFIKSSFNFVYHNVGKNITNGIYYALETTANDFKNKVFILYDIISYDKQSGSPKHSDLSIKKVAQYEGFLSRLDTFENFDAFYLDIHTSATRRKLRKNEIKLQTNFNIDYEVLYGDVPREYYDHLMDHAFDLISIRFKGLHVYNDIIEKKNYYRALIYKMVCSKKGVLHLINHDGVPIAMSFSFLSKNTFFYAINTFDVNFKRYNVGHILIKNMMKWCFANNFKIFDFSKGSSEYKLRWTTESYVFENHILFDRGSIKCHLAAIYLFYYFRLKQQFRDKGLNLYYLKFKFNLDRRLSKSMRSKKLVFSIIEWNISDMVGFTQLSIKDQEYYDLKPVIFDLIYSKPQRIEQIKLWKHKSKPEYLVIGMDICKKVKIIK